MGFETGYKYGLDPIDRLGEKKERGSKSRAKLPNGRQIKEIKYYA